MQPPDAGMREYPLIFSSVSWNGPTEIGIRWKYDFEWRDWKHIISCSHDSWYFFEFQIVSSSCRNYGKVKSMFSTMSRAISSIKWFQISIVLRFFCLDWQLRNFLMNTLDSILLESGAVHALEPWTRILSKRVGTRAGLRTLCWVAAGCPHTIFRTLQSGSLFEIASLRFTKWGFTTKSSGYTLAEFSDPIIGAAIIMIFRKGTCIIARPLT